MFNFDYDTEIEKRYHPENFEPVKAEETLEGVYKNIVVEDHQKNCNHTFAVQFPGILERCVKCKVYKWTWNCWQQGFIKVNIGTPGNWKLKELETEVL